MYSCCSVLDKCGLERKLFFFHRSKNMSKTTTMTTLTNRTVADVVNVVVVVFFCYINKSIISFRQNENGYILKKAYLVEDQCSSSNRANRFFTKKIFFFIFLLKFLKPISSQSIFHNKKLFFLFSTNTQILIDISFIVTTMS